MRTATAKSIETIKRVNLNLTRFASKFKNIMNFTKKNNTIITRVLMRLSRNSSLKKELKDRLKSIKANYEKELLEIYKDFDTKTYVKRGRPKKVLDKN